MQQQKATLEVVNGEHPGSVKFIAKAEVKAAAYIWQYILASALTADGVWQVVSITTAASATLDGLTSGSLYYFRVAYVTPAGTSEFCQPRFFNGCLSAYLPRLNSISTELKSSGFLTLYFNFCMTTLI